MLMVREQEMTMRDKGRSTSGAKKPEWAQGLKKLYDSVVEEPLPDDLAALLARLDEEAKK